MKAKVILFLLLTLSLVAPAFAVKNYPGNWDDIQILYQHKKFIYYLLTQGRFNFDNRQSSVALVRPAIGYWVSDKTSLWLGYDYFQSLHYSFVHENTFWQQMQYQAMHSNVFHMVLQTRLDERFFYLPLPTALRLRERVYISLKNLFQTKRFYPVFYDEMFFNLNHPTWVSAEIFSQNRAFLGIAIPCNKTVTILVGYMNRVLIFPRVTEMEHIVHFSLGLQFQ